MELKHQFSVPAPLAETWAAFEDIESVAGCFPGATVTSVEGDSFKGSCKVKLGPIALVYSGSGTFTAKDQSAGRFVIEAKGKDKRGNGTAGATVTASLTEAGSGTDVEVLTDLAITGKPAQFGRGVMQDVSDKLLAQFVECLQGRLGTGGPGPAPAGETDTEATSTPGAAAVGAEATGAAEAAPSSREADTTRPLREASAAYPDEPAPGPTSGPRPVRPLEASADESDDALDLGAAVLPVLLRSYGPQLGVALVLLLVGWLLGRRGR